MSISWKKLFIKLSDLIIFVYLVTIFFSYGNSSDGEMLCRGVDIEVDYADGEGFLDKKVVKEILQQKKLYPDSALMKDVRPYVIEKVLSGNPYVKKVNCYKTHTGRLKVMVNQRIPVFMAVSADGSRYFMDEQGSIMPESANVPYVMVVTGTFSRDFAKRYIVPLVKYIAGDRFWSNQVQQVNILGNGGVEIVPRVGEHMVYLGQIPLSEDPKSSGGDVCRFLDKKLSRLLKFYKYGFSNIGWNKYSYINIEFDNQIICKKKK